MFKLGTSEAGKRCDNGNDYDVSVWCVNCARYHAKIETKTTSSEFIPLFERKSPPVSGEEKARVLASLRPIDI